jgi:ribosomal protein S18 acetylase RimI-like enzyme
VVQIRSFRNDDVPALADLWNRGMPVEGAAVPLGSHDFDAAIVSRLFFEADNLLVALGADHRPAGFCHVAVGPTSPIGHDHSLDASMGTVAMLVVDPALPENDAADLLMQGGVARLRCNGAQVIYAGGQAPLNPFYWGLYGGSEYSGILDTHSSFQTAARRAGFEPVSVTRRFEIDLSSLDHPPRDPRLLILRRQAELQTDEDCHLESWWEALAIGSARPIRFRLVDRKGQELARATSWDMAGFERRDGRLRCGIFDVQVPVNQRGRGHAKFLILEAMKYLRQQAIQVVEVQTADTNLAATALYTNFGFKPITSATLYRLPGSH